MATSWSIQQQKQIIKLCELAQRSLQQCINDFNNTIEGKKKWQLKTNKNNAQALLEKLRNQNRQTATVIIDDSFELIFHRDDAAFELLQNEITENNKIVPVKDYLMAIVEPSQRDILTEILKKPIVIRSNRRSGQ